ncbi:hypothetical protein BO78DRAFT_319850 [Aspergillus sclerotiicarbonarius CBS 121057]|uniref:Uncharacterized protein n=1 Tax=Aspergillus sclerotiicarbonarius (strain CBS 121057 / IBT 28362) TaxID=1448318 RepID=A0A319E3L3_ASPSB|nr:hypothetical protein BO78DRAFT_319850 [Aspergillus sclerotiicarbonarius CBS 121057]
MGCRGLWNLRVNGQWYRSCHPRGRISSPDHPITVKTIKQLCDAPDKLDGWEKAPFPGPLDSDFDWVYTVDLEVRTLTVSFWDSAGGNLKPVAVRLDLATVCQASTLSIDDLRQLPRLWPMEDHNKASEPESRGMVPGQLHLDFGLPTPLNEVQARFFIDCIYPWRYYIDDPLTWHYQSPVFNLMSIALLRLAAWDLEVSFDCDVELPIRFYSIPSWSYPRDNIYWFHGFLVILHGNIESQAMISSAVMKAQPYIENPASQGRDVRMIIISPNHVAFAELSNNTLSCTRNLVLLSDLSATQCSPGFRALSRILTSDCWQKSKMDRETWQHKIPFEMLQLIMQKLEPRDAVAFSQASFTAERCYYASLPQLGDMGVRTSPLLVPCCGRRGGLEEGGIVCSTCYAWMHSDCIDGQGQAFIDQYVCANCQTGESSAGHHPGGIQRDSRRKRRPGCQVRLEGSSKLLQVRLLKPAHLRPSLRFFRPDLSGVPPELITYTIRFNGTFSGLAYGLDDEH